MTPEQRLQQGIASLALSLPGEVEEKLLAYLALLAKWNRTYNLTAIRNPADMVTTHLLDSLAVIPSLQDMSLLIDVGSGAGLPGLPLAIALPALTLHSIESSQKKAAFQQQAKIALGLSNVSVHCVRVEDYKPEYFPDAVISRAFASLSGFVHAAGHLVDRRGLLMAMKGQRPTEELAALPVGWGLESERRLTVPGLEAERHLVVLKRV